MLPEEDTVLSWWGESSKETISAPWSVRALAVSRKFSLWLSICGEIGGEGQTSDQPWPGFFWFLRTNDSPALRNLLISCVMIRPQLFTQKCVHMRYCLHACNRNKDVYSFHVHNISLNVKGNRSATSEPPPVDGCRAVAGGFWLCEWPLVRLASQHRPQILKTHNQHYPRHVSCLRVWDEAACRYLQESSIFMRGFVRMGVMGAEGTVGGDWGGVTAGERTEGLSEVLPSPSFPFSLYRGAPARK